MRYGMRIDVAFVMGAVIAGGVLAAEPAKSRTQAAEEAISRNLAKEQGRKYADSASTAAIAAEEASRIGCRDSLGLAEGKDTTAYSLFAMLNRRGRVKDLVVAPEDSLGACLGRRVRESAVFPPPPDGNYWIRIQSTPPKRSGAPGHIGQKP